MAGNLTAMIAAAFSGSAAPPVTSDPYYEYTTLLLPGNGTNGAQNNTFLDSSTNNFTITRNGSTTQGTFSPFSQTGWGNYFDGSVDSLSLASNAVFAYGTSDFTWEVWVFPTASTWTSGSGNFYIIEHATNGGTLFYYQNRIAYYNPTTGTGSALYTSGGTVAPNQWSHIAVSRESGTTRIYVNGQLSTSGSDANNYAAQAVTIGRSGGGTQEYFGYMSNVRIVKGRAVYTSAFTPPTAPLGATSGGQNPPQGTETSLLTCQSNRFKDNSTNNFTITVNGSPSVQAFSPFNPSASWSAATYGGSGYFDGSVDYLTVPQSAGALDLGSGQFSLEFWWYPTSATTGQYPFIGDSTGNWYVGYESSNIVLGRRGVTTDVNTTGFTLVANTWQHIVVTRQSTSTNDTRIFINGVLRGVGTTSQNYTITTTLNIGGLTGGYVTGYLSSTNLVKGSVPAAYQTSSTTTGTQIFTPPTSPSTSVTGTQLLLNYTNAGIYDATSKNDLETVADAKISTAQSKWGGSSIYLDGTTDYIPTNPNILFNLGSADFTVELWLYANTATGGYMAQFSAGTDTFSPLFGFPSGGNWVIYISSNGSTWDIASAQVWGSVTTNTWDHWAITRSGSTFRAFKNGTQTSTWTSSASIYQASNQVSVGKGQNGSTLNGYIQDFRVTKGYARYTANFTAPTAAFPTL
jgi:hypothetical protein